MKEIKIVLNKDEETFLNNAFTVYIDNEPLEDVESITIKARKPNPDVVDKHGILRVDELLEYTVNFKEPWF